MLVWRGAVITGAIGVGIGWLARDFASGILTLAGVSLGVLAGFFLVLPWLLRMMISKQFRSFSIIVARKHASAGN
jgi:flagellar biogenesis protein FliO